MHCVISCHSLSDSLRHCVPLNEMSWDHQVTAQRLSRMNYSETAPLHKMFAKQNGWMEITWTRMERPGETRLWAACEISSYVCRTESGSICVFVHLSSGTGTSIKQIFTNCNCSFLSSLVWHNVKGWLMIWKGAMKASSQPLRRSPDRFI